jgi:hypothetical protein
MIISFPFEDAVKTTAGRILNQKMVESMLLNIKKQIETVC